MALHMGFGARHCETWFLHFRGGLDGGQARHGSLGAKITATARTRSVSNRRGNPASISRPMHKKSSSTQSTPNARIVFAQGVTLQLVVSSIATMHYRCLA